MYKKQRSPDTLIITKICVNCYKTDVFDNVIFPINVSLKKYHKGNVCNECTPKLLEEKNYLAWLNRNIVSTRVKKSKNNERHYHNKD